VGLTVFGTDFFSENGILDSVIVNSSREVVANISNFFLGVVVASEDKGFCDGRRHFPDFIKK